MILVDAALLAHLRTESLRLDVHLALGLDFRTVGSLYLPLRSILEADAEGGAEAAFRLPLLSQHGALLATLRLHARFARPLSLYRAALEDTL